MPKRQRSVGTVRKIFFLNTKKGGCESEWDHFWGPENKWDELLKTFGDIPTHRSTKKKVAITIRLAPPCVYVVWAIARRANKSFQISWAIAHFTTRRYAHAKWPAPAQEGSIPQISVPSEENFRILEVVYLAAAVRPSQLQGGLSFGLPFGGQSFGRPCDGRALCDLDAR